MMIELYRTASDPLGAEIEDGLKELVLAHRVIVVTAGQLPNSLPAGTPLPALRDQGRLITGSQALHAHLRRLQQLVYEWRKYESDACYIGNEGETC
ncbi:MAG: hypothetical protein Kow0031_22650 [Anaerolineae bacterium]